MVLRQTFLRFSADFFRVDFFSAAVSQICPAFHREVLASADPVLSGLREIVERVIALDLQREPEPHLFGQVLPPPNAFLSGVHRMINDIFPPNDIIPPNHIIPLMDVVPSKYIIYHSSERYHSSE